MRASGLGVAAVAVIAAALSLSGCGKGVAGTAGPGAGPRRIVATYAILGSLVKDLVGLTFAVSVEIPNGLDPHEWEPSARDIELLNRADLIVENGLGLEAGMEKTLAAARASGVSVFTASDHVPVQKVGAGEGVPSGDPDQAAGASDPHLWMDPVTMKMVVDALAARLADQFGAGLGARPADLLARQADLDARLDALDREIRALVATLPSGSRRLVTGHESMGYFARRYGFALVGAMIPSLSTQAEVSASQIALLKKILARDPVHAVFTEQGTPKAVADAVGRELNVKAVGLTTHALPPDGSYFTFMRELARTVCDGLR